MKKSFILWIAMLITCMASAQVSTWDGTWEPWTHGTGTEADPFLIENAQQLAYLAYRVNNGLDAGGGHVSSAYHYKLMTDVNLNGGEDFQWTPIGYWNSGSDYQCFGGYFDGNGHVVSGLYINNSANRVGFFGYVDGTTIENFGINGGSITTTGSHAGGIIGVADGTSVITNCYNTGAVSASYSTFVSGGIVGSASTATITNCYNTGTISGYSSNSGYSGYSGGIVGRVGTATITNCYNTGTVSASSNHYYHYSGGILGQADTATITNCYNTGAVSAHAYSYSYSGGILGQADTATITNCYNTGAVSAHASDKYSYSGGILGQADTATITNCYNTGAVSAYASNNYSNSGGILGRKNNGTVTNSYYLNTCGGNNIYGGQPLSADAMQTQEFVELLNDGICSWEYDGNNTNSGYPILTGVIVVPETLNAANITQSHATLRGNLEVENTNVQAQGFEYKKSTDSQYQVVNVSGNGYISQTLSGLTPYTLYIYRVFCTPTDCGTYYGEEITFTTLPISVTTNYATDVTQTHATLNGNLNIGDAIIASQGFQYRKTSDTEYQTVAVTGSGEISTTISNLIPNTQYRFKLFCIPQDCDPIYGQEMTFNSLTINVTTNSASNVTESSATLNGHIDAGDAEVTDKGFKYWPANEPQNVSTVSVSTTGNISATISNLAQNTYQYRAFAESDGYTYQGGIKEFEISWLNNDTIFVYDSDKLHWVAEQCNSGVTFEGKCVKLMNDIELPFNVPNNMISIGSYPNNPFKGTFNGNGKHITNLYIDQPNTPYQGFFGYTLNANLYNVGLVNITASGRNYTGGMVAYAENTHMRDCYVNGGTLFALSYCGGLVGYQEQGTNSIISGCYNTCEVTGNNYVGGLIGFSNYSTVRNSYVAGRVAAQGEPVGAIIGGANDVLMYYCYFSIELTGQTVAIGENNFKDGEGLTNEQMRDPQFVATLNQGLVTPVWKADYEIPINNGFPIIVWQEMDITGIEEDNATINHLSLYPNPSSDYITIHSDDPSISLKHAEIYDMTGRKVLSETLYGQNQGLSIAKLHAGIYHVRIQTDNGCCTNLKLVVQ